jgi:hypothetical protein
MPLITLPDAERSLVPYRLRDPQPFPRTAAPPSCRIALAAAHVVADPLAVCDPFVDTAIDWDATIAYRRHLWGLGLGVAEAMDTAQRGMGLAWSHALELITRSVEAARDVPGARVHSGAGTDHLAPRDGMTLGEIRDAYEMQIAAIEAVGGRIILMASRALAAAARSPDDYRRIYGDLLAQCAEPVILHWLGDMFDPALAGYWGHTDLDRAMAVALDVIRDNAAKVDGIKISLLDKAREIAMRRELPPGVRMYTGDDFNYAELIDGDAHGHSDALLGIFDAIAPAAAAALAALDAGKPAEFHRILAPTVPLSRHIFQAPTRFYKTGLVFLAYLNGHQTHFTMVGGQQGARSLPHLAQTFRLADRAGLLSDPDLAAGRMRHVLSVHGIEA